MPSTAGSWMRRPTSRRHTSRRLRSTAPLGAEAELVASIRYIRRGAPPGRARHSRCQSAAIIGNTAEAYAPPRRSNRYGRPTRVTVNPYMGEDSVRPLPRAPPTAQRSCSAATSQSGCPRISRIYLVDGPAALSPGGASAAAATLEHARAISCWWWGANLSARNGGSAHGASEVPFFGARHRRAGPAISTRILTAGLDAHGRGTLDQLLAQHHLRRRGRGPARSARGRYGPVHRDQSTPEPNDRATPRSA